MYYNVNAMIVSNLFVALIGVIPIYVKASSPDYQCSTTPGLLFNDQTPLCFEQNADSSAETEKFDHPIWSHAPLCVPTKNSEYCTHTTASFRSGHGLSIIAYPQAADAISKAFEASRNAPLISFEGLEVRDIPGKGKGVITTKHIKKRTTILLDSPRIIASAQFPSHVLLSDGQALFNSAVQRLPAPDRTLVLSLDKSLGGSDVEDVVKTNAFATQISDGAAGDGYMCLFPSVSRINHACRPNSHARFIPKTLLMEIKTLRDIKAGEEISISYGKIDLKHAERQKLYKDGWGFKCTCDLCTADAYQIAGSDQRRARWAQVRNYLDHLTAETFEPQQVLAWENEVLELSEKEGLEILNAADYERMAYVHAGMGMPEKAKDWARKARDHLKEWTIVDGGPDNELRRVEDLLSELGG